MMINRANLKKEMAHLKFIFLTSAEGSIERQNAEKELRRVKSELNILLIQSKKK